LSNDTIQRYNVGGRGGDGGAADVWVRGRGKDGGGADVWIRGRGEDGGWRRSRCKD